MALFAYIYHANVAKRESFARFKDSLHIRAIEVDMVDAVDIDVYFARNLPSLILVEEETLRAMPEIVSFFPDESAGIVPVYALTAKKNPSASTALGAAITLFGTRKKPITIPMLEEFIQIGALANKYQTIKENVFIDETTGLYTKRHLIIRMEEMMANAFRHDAPLSFALLDIDGFKRSLGAYPLYVSHKILKRVAEILADSLRREDFIARVGDNRFAILLQETAEGADKAIRRILATTNGVEFMAPAGAFILNITGGIDVYRKEIKDDVEVFMNLAEIALVYAKNNRRGQYAFSTEVIDITKEDANDTPL